mgnify:CR=1 FL=1
MRYLRRFSDRFLALTITATALFALAAAFFWRGDPLALAAAAGVFFFLQSLFLYLLARSHSVRLNKLTLKVEEMAAGNLGLRIADNSGDEVGHSAVGQVVHFAGGGVAVSGNGAG